MNFFIEKARKLACFFNCYLLKFITTPFKTLVTSWARLGDKCGHNRPFWLLITTTFKALVTSKTRLVKTGRLQ